MTTKGEKELEELDRVFRALDHPARRHILIVIEAKGGDVASRAIAERFVHSWPTTTRHLNTLIEAGLLNVRKEGRERHYSINRKVLFEVGQKWFANFNREEPNT